MTSAVERAARAAHPYEEMAYQWLSVGNAATHIGAGAVGDLPEKLGFEEFLKKVKTIFGTTIRYTSPVGGVVSKVAVCGGSGSFLLGAAMASGADVFITADFKYHQFFDADGKISILDVGHFESEQFTIDLITDFIEKNFPKFAVLKLRSTQILYSTISMAKKAKELSVEDKLRTLYDLQIIDRRIDEIFTVNFLWK